MLLEQVESEQHHCICLQATWQMLIEICLGDPVIAGENIQIVTFGGTLGSMVETLFSFAPLLSKDSRDIDFTFRI